MLIQLVYSLLYPFYSHRSNVLFPSRSHQEGKCILRSHRILLSSFAQSNDYLPLFPYTQGPLAKVWLAATIGETRISKSFAASVKIPTLCVHIERPAAPFALRLSASLMLGVVRIYSRKSSILVSDLTKILSLLSQSRCQSRLHGQTQDHLHDPPNRTLSTHSNISAKRTRSFEPHQQNNLPEHATIANQEAITISVPPAKRRKFADGAAALQTFSESSLWRPDLASSSPEDVLTAMGLFLPTVTVPRHGEHVATASALRLTSQSSPPSITHAAGSARRHEQSVLSVPWSDMRRAAFRAREEDIMLKESCLDNVFVGDPIYVQLSSDDQPTSGESMDTPGPVRRLFHDNITPDTRSIDRIPPSHLHTSTHGRALDNFVSDEAWDANNQRNPDDRDSQYDFFTPLDLEPLQIADFPALTSRQPALAPDSTELLRGVPTSASNQLLNAHAGLPVPADASTPFVPPHPDVLPNKNSPSTPSSGARMSVRALVSPSTVASPVSADEALAPVLRPELSDRNRNKVPNGKTKRSVRRVPMDLRTEFDPEEFRATLLDPSDTLLPAGQPRTKGRRGQRGPRLLENIMWQTPSLIGRFAPEVADVWHQVTGDGWNSPTSSAQSPQTRSPVQVAVNTFDDINTVNDTDTLGDVLLGGPAESHVHQDTHQNSIAVEGTQEKGEGLSINRSGSPEMMREVRSDEANRSIPSVSGGGRSGSQSVPSDTRSDKNERDRLFDIVRIDLTLFYVLSTGICCNLNGLTGQLYLYMRIFTDHGG